MWIDSAAVGEHTKLMPKGYLTVTEAAARRGYNPQQIRDAINRGDLQAEKVGAIWLIRTEAVDALDIQSRGRPRKKKMGRPRNTKS